MSIAGLIAAAVGGAAEGYGKGAEMEMKKQNELDLRKQLMDAETERQLRVDEIKRGRDIAEETRKMSPEYIAQTTAANLERDKGALGNRTTLAPLTAEAATAEYKAGKPLEDIKTTDAIKRKIEETVTLSNDKDYLKGETALNEAKGAAGIKAAQIRADSIKDRAGSGGAGNAENLTLQGAKAAAVAAGKDVNFYGRAVNSLNKELGNATSKTRPDLQNQLLEAKEKLKTAEANKAKADSLVTDFTSGRTRKLNGPATSGRDLSGLDDPKYNTARQRDAAAD